MAIHVTLPGTQATFKCMSVSQLDKDAKLWVFDNEEIDSIMKKVEIVAYSNNTFDLEVYYNKKNEETMKSSFKAQLKKPVFVDGEMTRMRLTETEDIQSMVSWIKATQQFSSKRYTKEKIDEVDSELRQKLVS